jgi:SiaC family regulatory phosphoprotein
VRLLLKFVLKYRELRNRYFDNSYPLIIKKLKNNLTLNIYSINQMLEAIYLDGTEDTPKIVLDKGNNLFEISGRSLPEDAAEFYQPILDWLEKYQGQENSKTNFMFKLEYFNTASSKLILDILSKLEEIEGASVTWYYHEDDEDMEEAGEEFSELVDIPFDFKTY